MIVVTVVAVLRSRGLETGRECGGTPIDARDWHTVLSLQKFPTKINKFRFYYRNYFVGYNLRSFTQMVLPSYSSFVQFFVRFLVFYR